MRRIAPGKAPFDTAVAMIGLAVLVGRHAYDLVAFHFCLERTADTTVGAGCYDC